jgi:hypothetical protein
VKPTIGFTLPSAGVTPALSEKVKSTNRKMARPPFRSQLLSRAIASDFLVSSQSNCVIPSEAEGPRIFLDASRSTPNHGSTAGCDARASFRCLCHSEPPPAKNPASFFPLQRDLRIVWRRSSPLPERERIEGEGPYPASISRARFRIPPLLAKVSSGPILSAQRSYHVRAHITSIVSFQSVCGDLIGEDLTTVRTIQV